MSIICLTCLFSRKHAENSEGHESKVKNCADVESCLFKLRLANFRSHVASIDLEIIVSLAGTHKSQIIFLYISINTQSKHKLYQLIMAASVASMNHNKHKPSPTPNPSQSHNIPQQNGHSNGYHESKSNDNNNINNDIVKCEYANINIYIVIYIYIHR